MSYPLQTRQQTAYGILQIDNGCVYNVTTPQHVPLFW